MSPFFTAVSVKARIINALFIHALLAEHGKTKIGYLTAVIKPLGQVIMLTTIFSFLGRRASVGDNLLLFLTTGIMSYNLCIGLANKMMQINKSHKNILAGMPVTPLDISLAFLLSETLILILACIFILIGLGHFGYWDHKVDSILGILLSAIASVLLGYGIGLFNLSMSAIFLSYEKIWRILSMPLFMMSGIFFVADHRFPAEVISVLKYNPLLHLTESMRSSFYRTWDSTLFEIGYLLWFILAMLIVGLVMQKITQTKQGK